MSESLPPLSLYVHVPWCVRKCPYCDFNSHVAPAQIPEARYVDALLEDLALDAAAVAGRQLRSVFFGGGTPSLFAPESIGRLLEGARERIGIASDAEITLEANPGTIEHGRFAGYRDAGVNRVSLGAQSFDDERLRALGRIHGSADIARAVEELRRASLDNFNLDLMYGLPAQTPAQARADLDAAIALSPAHISHYQLTLEPGTVFYHRPPALPDDEETWRMQLDCQAHLAASGYEHYEVSAYARAGRRSVHNLNYWTFGDYLGVGAGAHGKRTALAGERLEVRRTARVRQPREYLNRPASARVDEDRLVEAAELPFEFMLNALRLVEGFALHDYETRTGLALSSIDAVVRSAEDKQLLTPVPPGRLQPTALGRQFLNDLQSMFLPDAAAAASTTRPARRA